MVPIMSCSLHTACLSCGLLLMSHSDIPWRFVLPKHPKSGLVSRDGNSDMGTRYLPGTRFDGYGYGDDFLPMGGTRTRPDSRWVRDEYFFPPVGNPTGTRYFTTVIILGCEQVKMCSFCYINYDLF
jgi:hypothetical protein